MPAIHSCLGMVQIASRWGGWLQSHSNVGDDGQMHASQTTPYQEETWILYQTDDPHIYCLANWRNGYFMNRTSGDPNVHRVMVNSHDPVGSAMWRIVSGNAYGLTPNRFVAFQAYDGSWLNANRPGDNAPGEPGEVFVERDNGPASGSGWEGWFAIYPTNAAPQPQPAWYTQVGGALLPILQGIATDVLFAALG